jgi:hypothetical protein
MLVNKYSFIVGIFFLFSVNSNVFAQEDSSLVGKIEKIAKSGAVVKFDDKGKSYLKLGMGVHFWYRYMGMNPGTYDKNTEMPIDYYSDFALRRMRMSAMINLEGRHFLYTQFGVTSRASYDDLHSGIFFHDFWYKARVANKTYVGAGMHMWNGLSRLSNVSYATQITLDNPGVNFPNVNVADDFVRQYGIFIQGQLKRIDYNFSVNKPMMPANSSKIYNDKEIFELGNLDVAYNRYHSNFNFKGYVSYSFLEKESVATTPFKQMTYFGDKGTFLNVGGGFQYTPEATGVLEFDESIDVKPTVKQYGQLALSVDLWYEKAFANKSVLNVYTAYYRYEYGPNYLKASSVMGGFASSDFYDDTPAQGAGINQFSIGTGNVGYFSVSYVLPQTILKNKKKLMPFYAVTYKDFDGLNQSSFQHDFGAHYLLLGNNVKLSAQYSTRPIFDSTTLKVVENKGAFILQLQAKF